MTNCLEHNVRHSSQCGGYGRRWTKREQRYSRKGQRFFYKPVTVVQGLHRPVSFPGLRQAKRAAGQLHTFRAEIKNV